MHGGQSRGGEAHQSQGEVRRRQHQHQGTRRGGGEGVPRPGGARDRPAHGRSDPHGGRPHRRYAVMTRKLKIKSESFKLAQTFTISRGSKTEAEVVTVAIEEDGKIGRGECVPYARYKESVGSVSEIIESLRDAIQGGVGRQRLRNLLKPGAARNAVDCAL